MRYKNADQYSQLLDDQENIAWDVELGSVGVIYLERNRTLLAPTNVVDGDPYFLLVYPPTRKVARLLLATEYEWEAVSFNLAYDDQPRLLEFVYDDGATAMVEHTGMIGARRGWRGYMDVDDIGATIEVVSDPADQWTEVGLLDASLAATNETITIFNKGFGRVRITPASVADYVGRTVMDPFEVRTFTKGAGGAFTATALRPAKVGFPASGGAV